MTNPETRDALVDRLARYESLVEVGIGRRTDVAELLATSARVTATDVRDYPVPERCAFVRDDITAPQASVYANADAIYALNCPPELHRPLWTVARHHRADCLFTTLGGDPPLVPAKPETLPGETLFRVQARRGGRV